MLSCEMTAKWTLLKRPSGAELLKDIQPLLMTERHIKKISRIFDIPISAPELTSPYFISILTERCGVSHIGSVMSIRIEFPAVAHVSKQLVFRVADSDTRSNTTRVSRLEYSGDWNG